MVSFIGVFVVSLIVLQIILFRVEINLQVHDFKGETPTNGRNTFKMSKKNNNFF
jgi:hypothetical protein